MPKPPIKFIATLPLTATAIQIHGEEGMRVTLDIAESELPKALGLVTLKGKQLEVEIKEH